MTWKTKNLDEIAEVRIGYPTPKSDCFFKKGIFYNNFKFGFIFTINYWYTKQCE